MNPPAVPEIDIDLLADRISAGEPLVDVRQPEEFAVAHVPGARLVPLDEVPARLAEFPDEGPVNVICKSGGRSAKAVEYLRSRGIDARNVAGGTSAWIEAGRDVERPA